MTNCFVIKFGKESAWGGKESFHQRGHGVDLMVTMTVKKASAPKGGWKLPHIGRRGVLAVVLVAVVVVGFTLFRFFGGGGQTTQSTQRGNPTLALVAAATPTTAQRPASATPKPAAATLEPSPDLSNLEIHLDQMVQVYELKDSWISSLTAWGTVPVIKRCESNVKAGVGWGTSGPFICQAATRTGSVFIQYQTVFGIETLTVYPLEKKTGRFQLLFRREKKKITLAEGQAFSFTIADGETTIFRRKAGNRWDVSH